MPRDLRWRGKMELAPLADLRETDAEDVGNGNANPTHKPESDTGIDDGFGTSPSQPPTTVPRRSPFPHSPSPVPGSHGYIPVATDFPTNIKPGKKPLDVNLYATKKTVAQGMMDLALLTANANQLRYVLEAGKFGNLGPNYYISITFISLSIVMQLSNLQQQRLLVEQLRREASLKRLPVSEVVEEIKQFILQHEQEDYLLIGFSSQKNNPFRERASCDIL